MDIILDVVDTLFGDWFFAKVFPVSHVPDINTLQSHLTTHATYQHSNYLFDLPGSKYIFTTRVPRNYILRQLFTLFLITWLFGTILYLLTAGLAYVLWFDKEMLTHPKFLKNQIRMEISQAMQAMPIMAFMTSLCFTAEVRGYAKLYETTSSGPGLWYNVLQFPLFIMFTDLFIYLIHKGLHHRLIYKWLHKPHHKWIMPTPFASHAFHPLDGFLQSLPYHAFPFIFPLQKTAYIALFALVNIWTVSIHDGNYVVRCAFVNGAACHTLHHLYFNYNYGQYTTLWDRIGGTYRKPTEELLERTTTNSERWTRQVAEIERTQMEVEGVDGRVYSSKQRAH